MATPESPIKVKEYVAFGRLRIPKRKTLVEGDVRKLPLYRYSDAIKRQAEITSHGIADVSFGQSYPPGKLGGKYVVRHPLENVEDEVQILTNGNFKKKIYKRVA